MSNPNNSSSSSRIQEFLLVVIMLVSLVVIIALIFWWTQGLLTSVIANQITTVTTNETTKETTKSIGFNQDMIAAVLNQRKDLLAIILGAFGAWIGAGAAYFFGRENLREATSSILKMKGPTTEEILMQTTIADLKPKPLPRSFKESDKITDVLKWLQEDPERFFAVIVDDQGKMKYAVHEEAIYRLIADTTLPAEKKYDESKSTIKNVVEYIEGQPAYKESKAWQNLISAAIKVNQKSSCAFADEQMGSERKYVAIVVDDKNVPVGYITTGDIRRLLTSR